MFLLSSCEFSFLNCVNWIKQKSVFNSTWNMMNKRAVKSSELIRLKIIKMKKNDALCVIFSCKITCKRWRSRWFFYKKRRKKEEQWTWMALKKGNLWGMNIENERKKSRIILFFTQNQFDFEVFVSLPSLVPIMKILYIICDFNL